MWFNKAVLQTIMAALSDQFVPVRSSQECFRIEEHAYAANPEGRKELDKYHEVGRTSGLVSGYVDIKSF